MRRREFLFASAAVGAGMAGSPQKKEPPLRTGSFEGTICLFSKHLPEMNWHELAQATQRAGFGGVDLTVRPAGHVLPERAREDLPKAVTAIRAAGLTVPMITTELISGSAPAAQGILSTAGELRIPFFKPGYYAYEFVDVRRELKQAGAQLHGLVELARSCGVQCGPQP